MSTTLTYGYKKPDTGDKGSSFFPDLEDNIDRLNGHSHDGNDSVKLPPTSLSKSSQTIASTSWVATSGGTYKQTVTMPSGILYDDVIMMFKVSDDIIHPTVEKVTASTYDIYINDNSVDVMAIYG